MPAPPDDLPMLEFAAKNLWRRWLDVHHEADGGVLLLIAKQGTGVASVTHAEALEVALCYGWIDGVRRQHDDVYFVQRFTPRRARSKWSKINRDKAEGLIASGAMRPAGLREVERAKADGRWDAAYEGQRAATVPDDLAAALRRDKKAKLAFEALSSQNRYAVLYRLQDAKKPETRARRLDQFMAMLREGRTIHPQ
jgi:uncharacterized protein YdeI (YjbR/CyaY-like superfamily)